MQFVGVVAALLLQLKAVLPTSTAPMPAPTPAMPTPTHQQLHYMENELTMFMHFSVCTFNDGCHGGQQNCEGKGEASVPYVFARLCQPPYPSSNHFARCPRCPCCLSIFINILMHVVVFVMMV